MLGEVAAKIGASSLSQGLQASTWIYPITESLHILGITLVVGGAFVFDLRLLGVGKAVPLETVANLNLRMSRRGFLLVVVTGVLLIVANPEEILLNRTFQIKMLLILFALINLGIYHWRVHQGLHSWAVAHSLLSLGLWTAVIFAGRLIAYT
ncbi:hypothetical protein QJS83_06765 [Bdellovibrio sp. 22V]|uniref:DUF6644 family protein n=1 Tax=Bdellovibrio TaxID=958 RepID=UPI002543F218|nr:DUF6644 family protein [Bdellovibrio sp. 22V]WII73572.1 hypothetical protein QJS83_06765 [Bdellovibrio sp. 22V]